MPISSQYPKHEVVPAEDVIDPVLQEDGLEQGTQLGDFNKIWQYLGQPLNAPAPQVPPEPNDRALGVSKQIDGDEQSLLKAVKWRDELEGGDLADNDDGDNLQDLSGLTKQQRKKARRKQRREALTAGLTNGAILQSGSENESEKESGPQRTPDTRSVIYELLHGHPSKDGVSQGIVSRLRSGKVYKVQENLDLERWPVASLKPKNQSTQTLKPSQNFAYAAAAAKKAQLIALLFERFVDERQYLSHIPVIHDGNSVLDSVVEGIHVFVDASNIMIGFHDALKLSRNQPKTLRMRRQPISFHNLSLILERGRPTAKRIVVGSDNFAEMQEAKAIGYETSILDRVHKAKELTPRQIKFKNYSHNGTGTGTGSGSETTAAAPSQYAPEKWVEQAVDEILHLKMMESVVDAAEPSIMVLATGDAAEAEYSGGFLKMVERALGKGWKVELASFRHNTSMAYRKREFRHKWGEKFTFVELDDFVEMMLGDD
ncbi:hypothetical protein P7C71_g6136, partial [Lecanoromycetidae sp. Uapishka_2]